MLVLKRLPVALLVLHAIVLLYLAITTAPTADEFGHLPSGIHYWLTGRTDAYRVNPPLVRAVAAIPMMVRRPDINYDVTPAQGVYRSEGVLGYELFMKYQLRVMPYLIAARIFCIPFSLLGAWIVYLWAKELGGPLAGVAGILLWSFDPNVLTNAVLVTPDLGAAAMGVAMWYAFYRWLIQPTNDRAVLLGVALGLALLTKFTWIVAIPLVPVLFLTYAILHREGIHAFWVQTAQVIGVLIIALTVVNSAYGFVGFGHSLSNSNVISEKFFKYSDTTIGKIPLPLPSDFTLGLDRQFLDLETRTSSYLNGQWRDGGWVYYYLEGLAIKSPIAFLPLLVMGCFRKELFCRKYLASLLPVVIPALAIFVGVSLNTGFNRHLRYVLPSFPFLFILASLAFSNIQRCSRRCAKRLPLVLLTWFCIESIWCFPHTVSFFNIAVGGPRYGHHYLTNSNVDWGQDLIRFQRWRRENPEKPIMGAFLAIPNVFIDEDPIPSLPDSTVDLSPGWYAISVSRLVEAHPCLELFRGQEPMDQIGYSILIYHLTSDLEGGGKRIDNEGKR